jgi:hypothetical protein
MSSMPMHTSGPPEAAQIEGLIQEFDALRAAMSHARRVRTGLFLLAVAFVAGVCVLFASFASGFASKDYQDKLFEAAQKKLEENSPEYRAQLQEFFKSTSPVVAQAFMTQVKKDLPGFVKSMQAERDKLAEDLRVKLEQRLHDQYAKILQKHSDTLKAEFPSAQDPAVQTKLSDNLRKVFEQMAKKYYLDDLKDEIVTLYDQADHFPAADAPGKNDPATEDQIIGELLEVLKQSL